MKQSHDGNLLSLVVKYIVFVFSIAFFYEKGKKILMPGSVDNKGLCMVRCLRVVRREEGRKEAERCRQKEIRCKKRRVAWGFV